MIITKQIKQIENLVNEFSDFARMPKPTLKENDIIKIINENIRLLNELDKKIKINLYTDNKSFFLNSDYEQISRVFFNLIKNSIESIQQKNAENISFNGNIDIEFNSNNNLVEVIITDNGLGFFISSSNINDILRPYYTTKKKGSGLGLSIVNKIINDHNGSIEFISIKDGAKIKIKFIKQ
jgi:two-component system nitrogen regulation sensor histidine kinase NtrY